MVDFILPLGIRFSSILIYYGRHSGAAARHGHGAAPQWVEGVSNSTTVPLNGCAAPVVLSLPAL